MLIFSAGILFASCGSSSGGGEASLDGDLTYEVVGTPGESVQLSQSNYDGNTFNFETLEAIQIPQSGNASGDLPDGDYEGYQLQASPFGGDIQNLTLRLLSDGEVLGETSEPDPNSGVWIVEVGNIPDFNQ
ncbi:MAG: hypothetical protein U5J95_08205 [Balneolaceae bacterium]|nr:hypothetical protein [Balneolaceae bacterium]